jgi:hypothetical protein
MCLSCRLEEVGELMSSKSYVMKSFHYKRGSLRVGSCWYYRSWEEFILVR